MKFKYTILYVEDVASTLKFFTDAFGVEQQFLYESGDYGELATGNTVLSFSSVKLIRQLGKLPAPPEPDRPTFEIAFETDDVAAALDKARSAGPSCCRSLGRSRGVRSRPTSRTRTGSWSSCARPWHLKRS